MYQREHGARTRTRHARGRTRDHTRNRIPNRMYEIRYVPGAASTPRTSFPVPSATAAPLFNTLVAKLGRLTRRSACPKGHPVLTTVARAHHVLCAPACPPHDRHPHPSQLRARICEPLTVFLLAPMPRMRTALNVQ